MDRILISACLLGRPVRHDGRGKRLDHRLIDHWQAEERLVPICPEVMAGFGTPRPPAEIEPGWDGADVLDGTGRVFEKTGREVTDGFRRGAEAALSVARQTGCRFALLTDGSPSCGSATIHAGRFDGRTLPGVGVVAALLRRHGVQVFSDHQILELAGALAAGSRT